MKKMICMSMIFLIFGNLLVGQTKKVTFLQGLQQAVTEPIVEENYKFGNNCGWGQNITLVRANRPQNYCEKLTNGMTYVVSYIVKNNNKKD